MLMTSHTIVVPISMCVPPRCQCQFSSSARVINWAAAAAAAAAACRASYPPHCKGTVLRGWRWLHPASTEIFLIYCVRAKIATGVSALKMEPAKNIWESNIAQLIKPIQITPQQNFALPSSSLLLCIGYHGTQHGMWYVVSALVRFFFNCQHAQKITPKWLTIIWQDFFLETIPGKMWSQQNMKYVCAINETRECKIWTCTFPLF